MGKVCQNLRAKWKEEDMDNAMRAVIHGAMSQRIAAKSFKVPRRTLRNHLESDSTRRKLGRSSLLTVGQERELVSRILRLAAVGYPVTAKIARHQVFRYCQANNITHHFNSEKQLAGKGWFKLFKKRHPQLTLRKAQNMNPARAQKLNKFIVNDYFVTLENVLNEIGLKNAPEHIFNIDEKGCRLILHHQQSVLALKGVKRLHLVAPEHAQNVTVVGCVSAGGSVIPPMILFKGKRLKPEFLDNLPSGTLVKMAPKGSMTTELFVSFIEHLAKYKLAGPILLIFDGARCHLDYAIVGAAEQYEIKLLCFPSNTTHELQPLDKSVYRSFEANWDQEVLRYWDRHADRAITKARFNIIFTKVWCKCMTQENIISGFRATGIFPFDPTQIPDAAFAPSIPTFLKDPNEGYSSEDDIPLAELMRRQRREKDVDGHTSFHELMETPDKVLEKEKPQIVRKKSLSYKAQVVTKALFATKGKSSPVASTSGTQQKRNGVVQLQGDKRDNWWCQLCRTARVLDMRKCSTCSEWVHEECIGFSEFDDEEYECPKCQ